jgi:type IV pilus assembly protein PilE
MRMKGFGLVECMITVFLIGILTTASWSYYNHAIQKSHSVEAETILWENAQFMHRWYRQHGHYKDIGDRWPTLPFTQSPKMGSPLFNISFSAQKPSHTGTDQFIIRATKTSSTLNEYLEIDEHNNMRHCKNKICTPGKLG